MERRVKERLIGASILVALTVLVVPELLSGPKPSAPQPVPLSLPASAAREPVRTVTVDLATSKAPAPEDPTLEPEHTQAASASSAASAEPPASEPELAPASTPAEVSRHIATLPADPPSAHAVLEPVAPAPSVTAPAHTAVRSTPAESSKGGWVVQLGSFASRGNAETLAAQLKARGFVVGVSGVGRGRAQRFRVRSGALPDRGAAEHMVAKLKSAGHTASIVAPAH